MIQMKNVSNRCGDREILKDINLSIKEGERWVLFGKDGVGKTTLLHLLMGYNISYRGKLALMGSRPNWLTQSQREKVRFVPDDLILEKDLSGKDFFKQAHLASARYNVEIQQWLCRHFGFQEEQELLDMSYQDNKLMQMIAALSALPQLLILDEPMNFLEEDVWKQLLNCIRILGKRGMAVLIAAEEYEDVFGQCDHYALLRDGKLVTGTEGKELDMRYASKK